MAKYGVCTLGKLLGQNVQGFHKHHFLLEKLWLYRHRYLANTFSKCHAEEYNQQYLLTMIKFELLKIRIWKYFKLDEDFSHKVGSRWCQLM